MADFDITSLLANSAKTNADFDFSKLATAYYEGQKQQYEQRTRDAFQDPSLYGPDGQIDPYKGVAAALKAGGTAGVEPAAKIAGIADILSQFGNAARLDRNLNPNAPRSPYETNSPNPPSISGTKGAQVPNAPDLTVKPAPNVRGGGDQSGSLVSFLDSQGVAPEDQGQHIVDLSAKISKATGKPYDANAPLARNDPRVRGVLADWIRNPTPQTPQPQIAQAAPQPQTLAPAPVAPAPTEAPAPGQQTPIEPTPVQTQSIRASAVADPTLGGVISQEELRAFGSAQGTLAAYEAALRRRLPEKTQKEVQSKVDAIREQLKYTGEKKNALESGFTSPLDYDVAKANTTELGKQDIDTFQKRNIPIQAAAQMSYDGQDKAKLMKQLTLDPNFYSGPLSENVQTYNQFKSVFGQNPSAALPQEAFNKVTADMLTEQIKAMGNSGVGRVLMAEVNNMKKSLAGLGITATTNRALAEIVSRNYDKMQKIAEIANGVPQVPGQMNRELDKRVQAYLAKNPLFTPQELAHPALLGAPDAPPGAEKWNQAQGRAWGAKIGLKPGDPVRINGVIRNLQ